ncbi:hypothetical protein ACNHKD_01460 [Methylocystis sp. JAN1]|uniref:hypothetical protein n=1 Tax=Methylocystis sp. JAN1 TaxID=3397211 RepID=UPI003FA1E38E
MTEFEEKALQKLQEISESLKHLEELADWLAERIKQRETDEKKAAEIISKLI